MFNIKEELKNLPEKPGVYIMHNSDDEVIYVGKAKILKNRVRQYFQKSSSHTPKVRAMVSNIKYFEYIVTDSEVEALVLECTLIKKHRPKYNILLKDDKQYPYLKVTINEEWPRIFKTRELKNDGAKYFGPYMGTNTIRNTLDIIQKIFSPPTCSRKFPEDIKKGRPCLNYHIKNCFAPCTGNVTNKEYRQIFFDICAFLENDHKGLIKELEVQMREASKNLEFEKAAAIRDKIKSINQIDEKQKVINSDKQNDKDVIAVCMDNAKAFIEIFFIRGGKLSGRENFMLDNVEGVSKNIIVADFVKQFYQDSSFVPQEVIVQYEIEDKEVISEWLSGLKRKKVEITCPKRGEKVRLVEMAAKNADIAMKNYFINKSRMEDKRRAAYDTGELLGLDKAVRYIEAYDISNISGDDNVASMVVFENGKPLRSRYRKFKIKSFEGADDYRAMQEVLYRRLNEAREEKEKIASGEMSM
ncbi:MAG: excinuclease ABC subunit UvrC, partial [Clostridia bacterium]|nr:excinuclease ABC subunit UvrC [Clostridia bacterium]